MNRCDSCGADSRLIDWNGDCSECAKSNPHERAAIALHSFSPAHWFFTWERLSEKDRDYCRNRAAAILTAAVDVGELAAHIGPDHARKVRDHLLGSQEPA